MKDFIKELLERNSHLTLHNANEAETRKKLIDKIIEEVLDWKDFDISYEERVSEDGNTTFADYIIRTADISILIEAKRIGDSFNTIPNQKRVKLSGQIMEGKTGDAIKQARNYCRKKSIPFAVVTNGSQWILFPAVRTDQVSFSSSYAIVFDSLERVLGEESEYFKSLLSRDGVIDGNLATELIGRNTDQFEERRLNRFFKGSGTRSTNPIYPLIENEVISAFSDSIINSDKDLLEKCYVKNADRQKFDNRIKMHLQKREPLFSSQPKRPMRKRESASLFNSITAASSNSRPLAILILGTVGTGKTTFLQYTRRVASESYFEKSNNELYPHWIDIDFRNFSQNESPINFIYSSLFEYIKNDDYFSDYNRSIKNAYSEDIKALKSGPMFLLSKNQDNFNEKITEVIMDDYNKVAPYVDKLIKYGAAQSPVFLVIDNIDQFEDDETQSNIFSDAIALAGRLNINLIIAMRESTYVDHRNSPTFDAFDFDPIHIEPPEIPAVLSRRFFLTGQMLSEKKGSFTALNGADFKVDDLSVFIDIVKSSVLGTEIGDRIDVLSNHDVRLALRMTREFLARGYTDPAKALQTFGSTKKYTLPKQEAFRSILLGNQSVYSEEYSVIGNPFDSRLGRSNGELLRMFVLGALVKHSSNTGSGSLDGPTIRDNLKAIGFSESDTIDVLSDLCEKRFIHTKSHGRADLSSSYFASRLGGHIIRSLLSDFTFVENILMDTFISDKAVWEVLKLLSQQITDERNVVDRLKLRASRCRSFYSYMITQYKPLLEEATRRSLDPTWLSNPLEEMLKELEDNMQKAIDSAERNYGNNKPKKA
ncbi:P-loop NTPase fold protein [Marinomonas primoryensis]|uniref:HSDR_N/ AAA_16 superfamily protein n=1 Tax=Marinomonas primoryensis TaxID=178399 RepID=A0A859CSF2_9GAMM|nr:P-loop NTPase fold protein [Marinomonas primoryensis]QKK79114.1 HSDR_N/ AAA_16 superfamily protein [Marinomonas primoryensis]